MKKYKFEKAVLIIIIVGLLIKLSTMYFGSKPRGKCYEKAKPTKTKSKCLKTKTETIWEYHWGYNEYARKWHYHYGPNRKVECVEYVVDSVEIK